MPSRAAGSSVLPAGARPSPFFVDGGPMGSRYMVNPAHSAGIFGGLHGYPATDDVGRTGLIALVTPQPRHTVLTRLRGHWIPGLTTPLADAASSVGHVVICRRPEGAAPIDVFRAAGRDWTEATLLYEVMRPVARCLAELHRLGVAHGSVAPSNLFANADGAVVLGPFWNEPVCDPQRSPKRNTCLSLADDIHALGQTLLVLFRGATHSAFAEPHADCTQDTSCEDQVAPVGLARLLRDMLHADPTRRPNAAALTDPCKLLDVNLPKSSRMHVSSPATQYKTQVCLRY